MTPQRFLTAGEAEFSDRIRNEVGTIMFEGSPVVDYDEWRQRLAGLVARILADPDLPYAPIG
ncbi:MAG TPA: hypothetical protein VJ482_05590 [Acidimicrobiia bacterium]|nr:hypothetical protein [Acidimicrobiia bacterium]